MSDKERKSTVTDEEAKEISGFFHNLVEQLDEQDRYGHDQSDSDTVPAFDESFDESEDISHPLNHQPSELMVIVENLILQHDTLKKEAEAYMMQSQITSQGHSMDPYAMALHKNAFIRLNAAQLGFLPDILKNDSVAEIRFETLKQTGSYSEHYRTREDSPRMLKELIRQGVDPEFYISQGGLLKEMVETQEAVDKIIDEVIAGDKDTYKALVEDISTVLSIEIMDEARRRPFINAIEMLTIHYEEGC